MLTEPRRLLTLVDILAGTGRSSSVLEAIPAQALVGANSVLAAAVQSANTTAVNAALVDVDAIVVRPNRMTGRTDAVIAALPILAGLALAALVRSLPTLVDVDAVLSGGIHRVTGQADHYGRASIRSQSVDALLHGPEAGIRRSLALVDVHAFAAGAGLEAARTVRPSLPGRGQRRRGRRRRRERRDSHRRRRHRRRARRRSRYTRDAIAAVRAQGVSALVPGPAVVGAQDTLVVVLADLRRGVEGVSGTAGQEARARVTADRVVASLRRQAVVLLQLTFVDIDAGLREIIAPETGLASAHITAYGIDAVLVAAASILELPALVDVDAAAIPHEPGAAYTLLVHRRRHRRRGRFPGHRDRR